MGVLVLSSALSTMLFEVAASGHCGHETGKKWNPPHDVTVRVITEGLVELGLLSGDVDELIESGAYTDFYMHRAGHWLGLDVHDVGEYRIDGKWRPRARYGADHRARYLRGNGQHECR